MLAFIDSIRLQQLCDELMDGHISYGFGSKAALTATPQSIHEIDCSGFVRYLMYQATSGRLTMPDGSWIQNDWCRHQALKLVPYQDASLHDSIIRIAFLPPTTHHHHHHAGHVWLIQNGLTMESHGGVGPSRRAWNTTVLLNGVRQCYELAIASLVGDFAPSTVLYA